MTRKSDEFEGETLLGMGESPTLPSVEEEPLPGDVSAVFDDELEFAKALIGQTFDEKYHLKKLIGQGGMGAVFEAEHVAIGNRVAVKVLFPDKRKKRESLARFRREARAAGTIGHPNIATVFDMGRTEDGISYLVMEFCEGASLADIVARSKGLDPGRVINITRQVLEALEAAHAQGIVHRDIKPENVMVHVDESGVETVRVLDFGISKMRRADAETHGLTRTGTVLGTPMYMAPEQARGEADMDHRIDLYAVGAMMYVMLSGRSPYQASNYNALLAKILTEDPVKLTDMVEGLDDRVVAVVERAMARDRDLRFRSAREFINALDGKVDAALPETVLVDTIDQPAERRVWPIALAGAAVTAFAVGLGAAWALGLFGGEPPLGSGAHGARPDAAARPPRDAAPIKATAIPEAGAPAGDAQPPEPRTITFRLTTEPADARVFINGSEAPNPLARQVRRDESETLFVRVEAEGYQPVTKTYARTEDLSEHIVLKRKAARVKRGGRPPVERGNFKIDID